MSGRTRKKTRHNEGRKPLYKEFRLGLISNEGIALHGDYMGRGASYKKHESKDILQPRFADGALLNTNLSWSDNDHFMLKNLCDMGADVEQSSSALGRTVKNIVHRARDLKLELPDGWKSIIKAKYTPRIRQEDLLCYPYIKKPRPEHADLMRVNDLVPKGMLDWMRADICQEVMLALFEGNVTLEELEANKTSIKWFIKKFYKEQLPWQEKSLTNRYSDSDDDRPYDERAANSKTYREMPTYTEATQEMDIYNMEISATSAIAHGRGIVLEKQEIERQIESGEWKGKIGTLTTQYDSNHAIKRAKERYGFSLTYADLVEIAAFCKGRAPSWKNISNDTYRLQYRGRPIVVVIDGSYGRVVTFLPPGTTHQSYMEHRKNRLTVVK